MLVPDTPMPEKLASSHFRCGPLDLDLEGAPSVETERARLTLNIYTAPWKGADLLYRVRLSEGPPHDGMISGSWLQTGRMNVNATPEGLRATCLSGLHGSFDRSAARWEMILPKAPVDIWRLTDVEHLLSLVLTTGWRALGWVPMHAGAVMRGGICAVLCAPSGGGKTTFTTALLRRGWNSLGDDKLLLRSTEQSPPELRALVHSLNLFPHSKRWFPELEGITEYPAYSVWTDKRRVPMDSLRPGSAVSQGAPTHVVRVSRREGMQGIKVSPLDPHGVLDLLLRQTVIPRERAMARWILDTITRTARSVQGLAVEIGDDAYDDPDHLSAFEEALSG